MDWNLSIEDDTIDGFTFGASTSFVMEQGILAWNLGLGVDTAIENLMAVGNVAWDNGYALGSYSGFGFYDKAYTNVAQSAVLYVDNSATGGGWIDGKSYVWVENLIAVPEPATVSMILVCFSATEWMRRRYRK